MCGLVGFLTAKARDDRTDVSELLRREGFFNPVPISHQMGRTSFRQA